MPEKAGLSASIHTKKGHLYAVIQYKENGKHKSAWRSLGLPENAPQSKIKKAYREAVGAFEEELDQRRMEEAEDPNAIPIITYLNQYLARVGNELQLNNRLPTQAVLTYLHAKAQSAHGEQHYPSCGYRTENT